METGAYISEDGLFRYNLTREWDPDLPGILFVMLNPSTADAVLDDPTIRRCIGFAKREGGGFLEVVNLFAFRATDPADMKRAVDPIGPDNDRIITQAVQEADKVICGWGAHGSYRNRDKAVTRLIRAAGAVPYALGITNAGQPRHPLYLKNEAPLMEVTL